MLHEINNLRQSDIQTRSELGTARLNEPHFDTIKRCGASLGPNIMAMIVALFLCNWGQNSYYLVVGDKNTPFPSSLQFSKYSDFHRYAIL